MIEHDYKTQLFFATLQTKDVTTRKHFLEELEKEFDVDDPDFFSTDNNNGYNNGVGGAPNDKNKYYPIILRLAHECPFEDVRNSCREILENLENQGVRIPRKRETGPSKFISNSECTKIETDDLDTQSLFIDAFLLTGRLSHIHQILAYHVPYLSCFLMFESKLMRHNGPLPVDWRYYIGIMGSARHHCGNLIEECERMFLTVNGDPKWLRSIDNLPKKLQKLHSLNKLLAHQPWLITIDIIKEFFIGPATETWSVSELIHGVVILLHYQTLSGFVFGCGITPEIDMRKGHTRRSPSSGEYSSGSEPLTPTKAKEKAGSFLDESSGTAQVLYEKIQKVQEEYENNSQDGEDKDEAEKLRQFNDLETNELNENELTGVEIKDNTYDSYLDDKSFHYEEFAKREKKDIEVFRAHDYNWQEHCFAFVNRLYPDMGTLLDEKFTCSFNLTYNRMGDSYTDVDTSKFRVATWNYIHLIYGIYHDDYMYYEVNKLLEKPYKSYIKKVACFPEQISFLDYWEFYTDFLPSEKVHINLLVLESRFQAVLLYVSRVLMKYMDTR